MAGATRTLAARREHASRGFARGAARRRSRATAVTLPPGFTRHARGERRASPTALAFAPGGPTARSARQARRSCRVVRERLAEPVGSGARHLAAGSAARRATQGLARRSPSTRQFERERLRLRLLHAGQERARVRQREHAGQSRVAIRAGVTTISVDPAAEIGPGRRDPRRHGGYHIGGGRPLRQGRVCCTCSAGDGGCDWAQDSGCAGANDAARDQHVLVGKILRITSTGGIPPSNPFQEPGPRGATSPAERQRATNARRRSPGGCGTRSASPSTRTRRPRASSSTTSARAPGRRSTSASPARTTAGTCVRFPASTAR